MPQNQRLQFSIGPVQGFVAQSRRTRDLWASSFLLSHLAEVSLDAVSRLGGNIILPSWNDDARAACRNHDFGTVPNRFVVDFADMKSARAAAEASREALMAQWRKITDDVWINYVRGIAFLGDGTEVIWNRQVNNFWEISWVIDSPGDSDSLLAARKNWRTTPCTVEPGDHCTMMNDRQELSGWIRSVSSETRGKQDDFWDRLHEQRNVGKLDLDDDERFCAIAMIKRFFPRVASRAIGRDIEPNKWPSTAYVAAIPWLGAVASSPMAQMDAQRFGSMVRDVANSALGERQTWIHGLARWKNATGDFLKLDGNFFQRNAVANPRVTPLDIPRELDAEKRRALVESLASLSEKIGEMPSAFYALLLMDGDSMGALLGEARKLDDHGEQQATLALSQFSRRVPEIIGRMDGITIYAGGDDVLAMLPLTMSLPCAMALKDEYRKQFQIECGETIADRATVSGAIVYAHYHTPLRDVLTTAHHLLDDVAKDSTGRDSLAMAVFKASGITAQWSAPWRHILAGENGEQRTDGGNILDDLSKSLSPDAAGQSGEFSTSFLYNVRDRFAALTDNALTRPGEFGKLSQDLQKDHLLERVLEADYLRGLSHRRSEEVAEKNKENAKVAIRNLLKVSQRVIRTFIGTASASQFQIQREHDTLGIDGALLVRFLANDGREDTE